MKVYATSKNTGPGWSGPDPITLLYLGTSLEEAEKAVGDFSKYEIDGEREQYVYSALPREIPWKLVKYFAADGHWRTIVKFDLYDPDEELKAETMYFLQKAQKPVQ